MKYLCILKSHKYNMYKKTVYTAYCDGELALGTFGKTEVYICRDCKSVYSKSYVERAARLYKLQDELYKRSKDNV
jgi:hypothetical protein